MLPVAEQMEVMLLFSGSGGMSDATSKGSNDGSGGACLFISKICAHFSGGRPIDSNVFFETVSTWLLFDVRALSALFDLRVFVEPQTFQHPLLHSVLFP